MAAPSTFTPTAEQAAVIEHIDGHLQVVACDGAGKTEAISRRVCALIDSGVEPSEIIAFTFTERAAESLKNRLINGNRSRGQRIFFQGFGEPNMPFRGQNCP